MRRATGWTAAALVVAALAAQAGCSGPGGPPADEVRRRLMQRQQVKLHQRLFFVGIADGASLEEATQSAYGEITRQLTWLPDQSRDLLVGMYRVDRTSPDKEGRIHVLAVLEREAASAHLLKLAKEGQDALKVALAGCETLVKDGDVPRAKTCLAERVSPGVERVRALLAASRAAVGDMARPAPFDEEQRAEELQKSIGASEVRGRSVLVSTQAVVDGKRQGSLDAEFSQSVASAGLKLAAGTLVPVQIMAALEGSTDEVARLGREAGAGYVVLGSVEAKYSSEDSGQFFAWATGRVRVIETTAGKAVADLSYDKIKGGHISRQQACEKALHNAVDKLKRDLQLKLRGLAR